MQFVRQLASRLSTPLNLSRWASRALGAVASCFARERTATVPARVVRFVRESGLRTKDLMAATGLSKQYINDLQRWKARTLVAPTHASGHRILRRVDPDQPIGDLGLPPDDEALHLLCRGIPRRASAADLRPAPPREGSLDALRWPSLIGGRRVYRNATAMRHAREEER